MKIIALYGNLTKDLLFFTKNTDIISCTKRFGGIHNLFRVLDPLSDICPIMVSGNEISNATIIIDRCGQKSSFVEWRLPTKILPIKSDWHHIAYLDKLEFIDADWLKKINGIISVDLCSTNYDIQRILDILNYNIIDYLFCNETEFNVLFNYKKSFEVSSLLNNKKLTILVHSDDNCLFIKSNGVVGRLYTGKEDLSDVVGAGDYFAAGFILDSLIRPELPTEYHITFGFRTAWQELRKQNNLSYNKIPEILNVYP